LFIADAFTPNGDGTNEFFKGLGYTRYINRFEMQIYNRWGELIFETDDIDASWDGTNQRNGRLAPAGVYLYVINFTGLRGDEQLTGYVTLIQR
jgi:gliding motility-associated-like protein